MESYSYSKSAIYQRKYSRIHDLNFVKTSIANFVFANSHVPFSSTDIKNYLQDKYSIQVTNSAIRKWLKNELRFSFKRSAPRPISLNMEKQLLCKLLFSAKIVKVIDNFDVFINIDESILSKNVIENYSWTLKGVPTPIKSIVFSKSVSVIAAITTKGLSFCCIRTGTTDSLGFIDYFKDLFEYLATHSRFKARKMWVILDNAKYHTSKYWLNYLNKTDANIYFLRAYSPEL